MKSRYLFLILYSAAVLVIPVIFGGCSPYDVSGTRIANVPPVVQWAMIPQDSTRHTFNPTLKWYGKDIDGQISALDYQYQVSLKGTVDSLGGPAAMAANFPSDLVWTSLGNVTSAKIPLYASQDTSVYVDQYAFLRAQDDKGAYSNIIYLYLSRNNHPPTCHIFVPQGPQWCLPDTSEYWHGITVSWEGKDSLDYTGYIQPDFLWEARLYGPFADSVSADTNGSYWVIVNSETGERQIPLEQHTWMDLRTGWYLAYAVNYDDAFVPAVEPARAAFQVYEPNWLQHPDETKDILIVNQSSFSTLPGNLGSTWRDSVQLFYSNLMADAGIAAEKWDWTNTGNPARSTLYNYRMVIVDDIDWNAPITSNPEQTFADYLNVGGKIWVIGRFSFANISNQAGRVDYGPTDTHPLAYTYVDLSAAMFPPADFNQAEFVGANPIAGSAFPMLEIDTLKIQALSGNYDYALPRVEYLMRNTNAQTLYTFNAINPDTSVFHGFPVAVRNENATFKSSYFSFPLFFIKYDQAKIVATEMIDWFLDR